MIKYGCPRSILSSRPGTCCISLIPERIARCGISEIVIHAYALQMLEALYRQMSGVGMLIRLALSSVPIMLQLHQLDQSSMRKLAFGSNPYFTEGRFKALRISTSLRP